MTASVRILRLIFVLFLSVLGPSIPPRPAIADPAPGLAAPPPELDRSTPRRTIQLYLEATRVGNFDRAAYAFDLTAIPEGSQREEGAELARMLRYALDRKLWIDIAEVSDEPDGRPADGPSTEKIGTIPLAGTDVPLRLTRVPSAEGPPVWVISKETARLVPELYEAYGPGWLAQQLPNWAHRRPFLSLHLWQWLGLAVFIVASLAMAFAATALALAIAIRITKQTDSKWDDLVVQGARGPLRSFMAVSIFAALAGALKLPLVVESAGTKIIASLLIASLAWLIMRVVKAVSDSVAMRLANEQTDEILRQGSINQISVARRLVNSLVLVLATALALLQFDVVRQIGVSVLASAGIAGIVFGLAAQRVLGNVLAGIQLSIARPIRIGDRIFIQGQFGFVEEINLTFVVIKTWDERRLVIPIVDLIEKSFENWTRTDRQLVGTILIYADYRTPVAALREEFLRLVREDASWDGETAELVVIDATDKALVLRGTASSDASTIWDLRCRVREKLVEFLQRLDGGIYLPVTRVELPQGPPEPRERRESRVEQKAS
jgi:small-conductance mechanosensitive channel